MPTGKAAHDLMWLDAFVEAARHEIPAEKAGAILMSMCWFPPDSFGSAILDVRDGWLEGNDEYLADVALSINEVYPANDFVSLTKKLDAVAAKFPSLKDKCDRWRKEWIDQYPENG